MDPTMFLQSTWSCPLPEKFDWDKYIDIEREFWALFPAETDGKRVNFSQCGLTAKLFVESDRTGPMADDETYFLMPNKTDNGAGIISPLRMKMVRRMTREEFRYSHLTAQKLFAVMQPACQIFEAAQLLIIGEEIAAGM